MAGVKNINCRPERSDTESDDELSLGPPPKKNVRVSGPVSVTKIKKIKEYKKARAMAIVEYGLLSDGKGTTRPQSLYPKFNLFRLALNKGTYTNGWTSSRNEIKIKNSNYNIDIGNSIDWSALNRDENGVVFPTSLYKNDLVKIGSVLDFETMITECSESLELYVDTEWNDSYFYHGQTCLIQITKSNKDHILGGIRFHEEIRKDLKIILESDKIIKYFYGAHNDVKNFKKDYLIHPVSCLDVLKIIKYLMCHGLLYEITYHLPNFKKWFMKWINSDENVTLANLNEANMKSQLKDKAKDGLRFVCLMELLYPDEELGANAHAADFRPRNTEGFKKLLKYARIGSCGISTLVQYIKVKLLTLERHRLLPEGITTLKIFQNAFDQTKNMLINPYKRESYPTAEARFNMVKERWSMSKDQKETWFNLFRFRQENSPKYDDAPQALIAERTFFKLIEWRDRKIKNKEVDDITPTDVGKNIMFYTEWRSGQDIKPEQVEWFQEDIYKILFDGVVNK